MKSGFLKIIVKGYLRYIDNREYTANDGLAYWRERIFNGLMFVILFFGTIAIIPNIIASIVSKTHLITITDSLIYGCILFLFYNRKLKLRYKVWIVISFIYLLSSVLLITLGPFGPGLIWLASSSFIAALIIGMRASVVTIILNSFIILLLALFIHFKLISTVFFTSYTTVSWIAVSLNVLAFNAITSIPLALIINALENLLKNEKELKAELIKRNANIEKEKDMALESDRLKSAFLANLSHEIRTPMNAIVGFSELIGNELDEPRLKKFSHHVVQNSKYLLDLINDIVDIAIIESGQIVLNNTSTSLRQILHDLVPTIEASALRFDRVKVSIIYRIPPELFDLELLIDPTRLKQILINLITNALKYTPDGKIEIVVKRVEENLNIRVIDTGVGIPDDQKSKIFSRFSKIDRNGKFSMSGIGLGLSITKGLCQTMGGTIDFHSKEGEGSAFEFYVPIRAKEEFSVLQE